MDLEKEVIARIRRSRPDLYREIDSLQDQEEADIAAWLAATPHRMVTEKEKEAAWEAFGKRYRLKPGAIRLRRNRYRIVAAVTGLIVLTGLFRLFSEKNRPDEIAVPNRDNTVRLVMDGGNTLLLNSEEKSETLTIRDFLILNDQKTIEYAQGSTGGKASFHTLIIPKYGEYSVRLEDRTLVRINSGGKLRYPVDFSGEKREVWLDGEAYFEVAEDPDKVFIVHAAGVEVRVLGTSFNVEANTPERTVKTTLVEGTVEVRSGQESRKIAPGQQAEVDLNHASFRVTEVDVQVATAWLKDRFYFEDRTLEDIMKTLGDWYDFEVTFAIDELRQRRFTVEISRFENMENILRLLEETRLVKFETKGRTLVVRPE